MNWIDSIAHKLDWLSIFRSPFKAPKPIFYIGKVSRGLPYFLPTGWFSFKIVSLGWKEKRNSPRHEWDPVISIVLFRLQFTVTFHLEDQHWESFLTYDKYTDKNLPTIARLEESRKLNPNVWVRYTEEGEVTEDWFLRSLKKRWRKKFI